MDLIKPKDIDQWINYMREDAKYRNPKYTLINNYRILRAILNWHIESNDKSKLTMPLKKRHRQMLILKKKDKIKMRNYLLPHELRKFLTSLKKVAPYFYPMALIQVLQVKRISEIAGMEWEFFDKRAKTYNFCKMVEFLQLKGQIPKLRLGRKNMAEGECDYQPLRSEVFKELERLKRGRDKSVSFIFHTEGRLWHYKEIVNKYNLAFKRAKLDFKGTHVLRHTGATLFLTQTKGDFMALKQLGGWSDINQVLHYGKVTQIHLKKAIKVADKVTF